MLLLTIKIGEMELRAYLNSKIVISSYLLGFLLGSLFKASIGP